MQSLPYLFLTAILLVFNSLTAHAQEKIIHDTTAKKSADNSGSSFRVISAEKARTGEAIKLDGALDEPFWERAEVATGFTQRTPDDGEPASEKTEARIIYTADAIYVGIKAYDSAMDSVAATLFRKDGSAYSDWVYVSFDSYDDDRTSFNFAVNPKGVRKDILIFNDDEEDIRWDAVWEAQTQMQDDGWTAEMRIPLSQLRYSTNTNKQSWGVNFQRRIARKEEIAFWSPTPQDASGFVSQYGQLNGINDLEKPGRLELSPYVSSNLSRAPSEAGNPFFKSNDLAGSAGGDLKYGLTSDLTITATINPDFGQVEADPAVINLSAFETFFPEQRPFFLEGNEIFQFGNTKTFNSFGNPNTFYTRRIGRAPQGSLSRFNRFSDNSAYDQSQAEAVFTDRPEQTTIAGAAKLSGKTSLSGFAGEFSLRKSGGEHWRASATYSEVSPGYETNDLGFQNRADYRAVATGLMYRETDPKHLRFYNIWSFETFAWNYDGDMIGNYYNLGGFWQFNNLWSFNANVNYTGKVYLDRLTRGGPVAERVRDWNFNVNINSNQTKKVSFNVGTFNRWDFPPENVNREYDHVVWAGIEIRPATNIQLSLSPEIAIERDTDQFVTTVADPLATHTFGSRYVFADIDRTTFSTEVRLDWTFSPDISFQLYARPFVTAGNFFNYKEFTTPRDFAFDIYGQDAGTIGESDGIFTVDPDGNGAAESFTFSDRDFNFRSVQTNAVFRWEYMPGSTLFLVWQQDRRSSDLLNDFRFGRDFNGLFRAEPTNVFLVKLSYWLGS